MVTPNHMLRRIGVWKMLQRMAPKSLKSASHRALYRPTGSVVMEPADRRLMLDFYRSDIQRLEGILNRDLRAWLS
jgi:hypothetical protein